MGIIAKLVYTVILLGLLGVILRELWVAWFDRTIYVGKFEVVSETGKDDSASEMFPKRIVNAQAILAQQFNDYQTRSGTESPSDKTFILPGMTPILLPPEVLAGINITVQDINLTQVLTAVRRSFLAPNEVFGNVAVREGSVLAAVDWPRAPRMEKPGVTTFLVPSQPNEQAVAAYIACAIAWAEAASVKAEVAAFPRAQFCDFGAGLGDLYALSEKASSPSGLDEAESARVRRRAAQLRAHYDSANVFPELYRLRADLLDLLPEATRTQGDLVEVQEDRLRYAMLGPELRDLPDEEKRVAALALARPAIRIEDGKLVDPPENWAAFLRRHDPAIRSAAKSVGLVLNDNGPVGTGFIVGRGLLLTSSFVLKAPTAAPGNDTGGSAGGSGQPAKGLRFCLGRNQTSCETTLDIGKVIYAGESEGSYIALASLEGHDILAYPALPIAEQLPAANTLIGQYAFVIGYPFGFKVGTGGFTERLLGSEDGQKRLMPGRILAVGDEGAPQIGTGEPASVFTSDISTMPGTAGGPFIEIKTGTVIGMSYGGQWKGERGKFAFAAPIPKEVLDAIKGREPGQPPGQ